MIIGALHRFPTWFGPPVSSNIRFQSNHATVHRFKSLIIETAYRSPNFQDPIWGPPS